LFAAFEHLKKGLIKLPQINEIKDLQPLFPKQARWGIEKRPRAVWAAQQMKEFPFGNIILSNTSVLDLLAYQETIKTIFLVPPRVLKSQT